MLILPLTVTFSIVALLLAFEYTKPTTAENPKLKQNDLFVELDTGDAYYWNEATQSWIIVGG